MVRICVPVGARSLREIGPLLSLAQAQGADLIEVRFDYLASLPKPQEVAQTLKTDKPLIGTVRKVGEGGHNDFPEERRKRFIETLSARLQYVDIELESADLDFVRKLRSGHCRVIVSFHDFYGTPDLHKLESIYERARSLGADLVKLACMVRKKRDISTLLAIHAYGKGIVAVPMGKKGTVGRIVAPLLGSAFAYAHLNGDTAVAPGMLSIGKMRQIYRSLQEVSGGLP